MWLPNATSPVECDLDFISIAKPLFINGSEWFFILCTFFLRWQQPFFFVPVAPDGST
jgi:hypothetical protein